MPDLLAHARIARDARRREREPGPGPHPASAEARAAKLHAAADRWDARGEPHRARRYRKLAAMCEDATGPKMTPRQRLAARRRAATESRIMEAVRATEPRAGVDVVAAAAGYSRWFAYDVLRRMRNKGALCARPDRRPTGGRPRLLYHVPPPPVPID